MSCFPFLFRYSLGLSSPPSSGSPKMDHSLVNKSNTGVQLDLCDGLCLPEAVQRSPELAFKCVQDPLESSHFSVGILKQGYQNFCPPPSFLCFL